MGILTSPVLPEHALDRFQVGELDLPRVEHLRALELDALVGLEVLGQFEHVGAGRLVNLVEVVLDELREILLAHQAPAGLGPALPLGRLGELKHDAVVAPRRRHRDHRCARQGVPWAVRRPPWVTAMARSRGRSRPL